RVVMAEAHVITHTLFPGEMEFTHAGSMETAAVLAFDPALVHLADATPASDRAAGEAAHALFRRPDVYPVMRDFHDVAKTGWYGRPELATPGRAEEIAEAVADHVGARARGVWDALGDGGARGPGWRAPWCGGSAAWGWRTCRGPSPGTARCWSGCAPAASAAPTSRSWRAPTAAPGRPRCRSSSGTNGPGKSPRSVLAPSAAGWPRGTAWWPRTTPAAARARCAARAGTTCASGSASPGSSSTATPRRVPSRSTRSGPPSPWTRCRPRSPTSPLRWSTRAR